jgi:hypothetical protein
MLDSQMKGSWSPWIRLLSPWIIAAIVLHLLASGISAVLPRWQQKQNIRLLENQTRGPLLACASMLTEAMSQSFVKSAGSVLNPLHETKALDPRACNAYHNQLGTLASTICYLVADVRLGRLPAVDALQRLTEMHRDYVRLSCEIASAVATTERTDIRRSWDEIRDHTNMISNRLTELTAQLLEAENGPVAHPYFQNVPRA